MPTTMGSRSTWGSHDHGERRRGAERRRGEGTVVGEPAHREHADDRGQHEQADGHRRQAVVGGRARRTSRRAPPRPRRPRTRGPSRARRRGGPRHQVASLGRRVAGRAGHGRDEQVPEGMPDSPSTMSAGSGRPIRVHRAGTPSSPDCSAYSRATSNAVDPPGPPGRARHRTRGRSRRGCSPSFPVLTPPVAPQAGSRVAAPDVFRRRRQGSRSIAPRLCFGPQPTKGRRLSTTLRGTRLDEPEMPSGQIVLQAPPQIERDEGAAGVLMNAIPMLGSLGSIVLVATMGQSTGGRSYVAAGMFLFATLGFIVVQLDRQRKQRAQQVTGSRTEYLRYLGNVRQVAREAADQQRRALNWHHPDPAALPSLAEERSRVWEHTSSDANFLHVRYGVCSQPLSLELVPPESAPIDEVDPAAASALHRLLVVHRLQPKLPASIDLRAFDRVELCGYEDPVRSLARAMICSATAFHSPDHLVVAVLCSERNLLHWDWLKWLPARPERPAVRRRRADAHGQHVTGRDRDPAAPRPERPAAVRCRRAAAIPAHPARHRRHAAAAGQPRDPARRPARRDRPGPADPLGRARRRQSAAAPVRRPAAEDGKHPVLALRRARGAGPGARRPVRPGHRRGVRAPAGPAPHRDRGRPPTPARRDRRTHATSWTCWVSATSTASTRTPPGGTRPARDRLRVPIGARRGRKRRSTSTSRSRAQQGMGPHGLVIGATGSGKSEFLRTLVLGSGADPLARAAQHGAGRLQGWRDVRGHVRHAARLGRDHQPRPGADPRRPHAGRAVRRDGAPPGAPARGRQLRVDPRLREGPGRRRGARPAAVAVHRGRRVLRDALGEAGVHRPLRRDRPPRPFPRPAPPARLAAARGGPAARPRVPPVLPGRPAHVQRRRVAVGARRPRRLRAAADPRPRLPQARPVDPAAVQGGVRLRVRRAARCGYAATRAATSRGSCRSRSPRCTRLAPPEPEPERRRRRAGASRASRSRCSTSPSTGWSATARAPTRCGCRRSTSPTRSTS